MEPYRPYTDRLVVQTLKQYPQTAEVTTDIKRLLLTIPTIEVNINGQRSPLMVAASQTTASLARCFAGESRKLSYPEM